MINKKNKKSNNFYVRKRTVFRLNFLVFFKLLQKNYQLNNFLTRACGIWECL